MAPAEASRPQVSIVVPCYNRPDYLAECLESIVAQDFRDWEAVVVDDAAMRISHVIRGEDHLSNTPKHILLFRALGEAVPAFAHLPLILNPDRTKMSKRKSQTAVADYIAQGFTREALVNYLAFLGWSPGTDEDVMTLDEIAARFELDKVQKGGARFDRERVEWRDGQWIRGLEDDDLIARLLPFTEAAALAGQIDRAPSEAELTALLPIVRERLSTLASIVDVVGFLWRDLTPDPAAVAEVAAAGEDHRHPGLLDCGDHVVIINAAKIRLTGNKIDQKIYRHHSGFPGGLKEVPMKRLMPKKADWVVREAILGMLPKNKLRAHRARKLRIYLDAAGLERHAGQKPQPLAL